MKKSYSRNSLDSPQEIIKTPLKMKQDNLRDKRTQSVARVHQRDSKIIGDSTVDIYKLPYI